jgi:UDP-hydrolysing UDP-N-acetyl-D-glucosamine 2-epimerase
MKSVIGKIEEHPNLELQIILGGMVVLEKYGRILEEFGGAKLNADRRIHFVVEGENPVTMTKSAGLAITEFATAFENLKPDVVLIIADRFECLPIAMAASYMNIPVAHIEGGEVSGSIDESIRHAITKLAHIHFPASNDAAERIIRMGEDPTNVYTVGATSLDAIKSQDLTTLAPVLEHQLHYGMGPQIPLKQHEFLIVIQHPVTTEYEKNYRNINETLVVVNELQTPTVWIMPNMDAGSDGINKGIRWFREDNHPEHIHFFKSLPIELFAPLLKNSACIVGNSSSGIRESAYLGTPSVNIGTRQDGRQRGNNVIDANYDRLEIFSAIRRQLQHGPYETSYLYGSGNAAEKIVKTLASANFLVQKRITY